MCAISTVPVGESASVLTKNLLKVLLFTPPNSLVDTLLTKLYTYMQV